MRINDRNRINELVAAAKAESARKSEGSSASAKGEPDRVSLSSEVQKMRQAEAERISAIRHAIQSGSYRVDLERLAKSIVERELP